MEIRRIPVRKAVLRKQPRHPEPFRPPSPLPVADGHRVDPDPVGDAEQLFGKLGRERQHRRHRRLGRNSRVVHLFQRLHPETDARRRRGKQPLHVFPVRFDRHRDDHPAQTRQPGQEIRIPGDERAPRLDDERIRRRLQHRFQQAPGHLRLPFGGLIRIRRRGHEQADRLALAPQPGHFFPVPFSRVHLHVQPVAPRLFPELLDGQLPHVAIFAREDAPGIRIERMGKPRVQIPLRLRQYGFRFNLAGFHPFAHAATRFLRTLHAFASGPVRFPVPS